MKAQLFKINGERVDYFLAKVLVNIPLKSVRIKHGVESGFVVTKEGVGIKTFYSESAARHSCRLQKKAAKYKAAPKVLSDIFPIVTTSWGYETTKGNMILKWAYETEVATHIGGSYVDEKELVAKLKKAKVSYSDLHGGNMGMIGEESVRIDFGKVSTE